MRRININRWLSPFIFNIVLHLVVRLSSPAGPRGDTFWIEKYTHVYEMILSLPFCYLVDYCFRNFISKRIKLPQSAGYIIKEYTQLILWFYIISSIVICIFHIILSQSIRLSMFLQNIGTLTPINVLYYTILRGNMMRKKYQEQILQLEKIKSKQLETELEMLTAQYHPHFLFNALNTIYFQIKEDNTTAKQTVELLSDLLRYQLYDIQHKVKIKEEIEYLQKYIRFNQLRMSNRLVLETELASNFTEQKIYPLLFQPLLENAFKYVGGDYRISVYIREENEMIIFGVENSILQIDSNDSLNKKNGIGINNLKKRLEILYPNKHELSIERVGNIFSARLTINYR